MVQYCLEHEATNCSCPDFVEIPRAAVAPDLLRLRQAIRYVEAAYQALAVLPLGKFDGVFQAALNLKGAKDLLKDAEAKHPRPPSLSAPGQPGPAEER